jgi:hypothetical protein
MKDNSSTNFENSWKTRGMSHQPPNNSFWHSWKSKFQRRSLNLSQAIILVLVLPKCIYRSLNFSWALISILQIVSSPHPDPSTLKMHILILKLVSSSYLGPTTCPSLSPLRIHMCILRVSGPGWELRTSWRTETRVRYKFKDLNICIFESTWTGMITRDKFKDHRWNLLFMKQVLSLHFLYWAMF